MFWNKPKKFPALEQVTLVDGKKTNTDLLDCYLIPHFIIGRVGIVIKYASKTLVIVQFYKDRQEKEFPVKLMIPVVLLKKYEKESAHRLTKIFL